MALRPIVTAPHPLLKQVSKPVEVVNAATRELIDDMLETMYAAPGIGLAAIQVGIPKRIITMDVAKEPDPPSQLVLINPEIVWSSDTAQTYEEGCLSFPEQYAEVDRPASIEVKYLDRDGKAQVLKAEGLLAVCIQHEMDHLEGVLFVDHLTTLKRSMILRRMGKAKRLNTAAE